MEEVLVVLVVLEKNKKLCFKEIYLCKEVERITLPNPKFLEEIFPLQNSQIPSEDFHAENFELELKKFFAMGRRRTGRSSILARVIAETTIESGREMFIYGHYLDRRAQREGSHQLMRMCRNIIEDYKRKGCHIEVVKFKEDSFQVYLDRNSINIYNRLKIENNPTKVIRHPSQKEEFLNKQLLLLL